MISVTWASVSFEVIRNTTNIVRQLTMNSRRLLIRRPQPSWVDPMLATLTEERFSDKNWIFEKKYDGVRALAFRKGNTIRLLSRNKLPFDKAYPDIVKSLLKQPSSNFIIDGEIAAMEKGLSSFSKLQQRTQRRMSIYYFVFDLLYWDGYDVRQVPLIERKKMLRKALNYDSRIRFTNHRVGEGEAYFEEACRKNWEGIIAKRADGLYVSGRSRDWLKFKCTLQQEFVIVGYTDPQGAREGFGALLVGFYSNTELIYAGKVGTGFTTQTLQMLNKTLSLIETPTPLVKGIGLPKKNVHWVKPKLVAQIAFMEWTPDNKLRHPSFLGLREDKHPREVIREKASKAKE
jgi:bifunctional non-homologous end joining protein LigD